MSYNLTLVANSSGYVEFFQLVNSELMRNTYGILILLVVSVIVLIAFLQKTNNTAKAMAATSFIAFLISLLLAGIDMIPDIFVVGMLVLCAGSIAFLIARGG